MELGMELASLGKPGAFGSDYVDPRELLAWCGIPADDLPSHPDLRVPYRQVADSEAMGKLMAGELENLRR